VNQRVTDGSTDPCLCTWAHSHADLRAHSVKWQAGSLPYVWRAASPREALLFRKFRRETRRRRFSPRPPSNYTGDCALLLCKQRPPRASRTLKSLPMSSPSEAPSDGLSELAPTTQEELQRFLAENFRGLKRPLTPLGGRTALDFGGRLSKAAIGLDLTRLDRVVDFPARDMTVTVEAGIRIERLAQVLRSEGQRLPIDVAQPERATLGGAIATNTSGPRRFGLGTFRDYVIGLTAMTADGRVFHSGGRVVKNVAGYDLCKLLVGSLGTLAVITQVTLKLKPVPESSVLIWATFEKIADREAAVESLLTSETRPIAIETLNPAAGRLVQSQAQIAVPLEGPALVVGFEGSRRETDWQTEKLCGEPNARHPSGAALLRDAEADRLWKALVDFPVNEKAAVGEKDQNEEAVTVQVNVLPSKLAALEEQVTRFGLATICRAGDGILIGRFAEHARVGDASGVLARLADWTRQNGGALSLMNSNAERPAAASASDGNSRATSLMRELKVTFDPAGLLNPGRLFPEPRG
jgi:glycolate oxidase FAD binding subunit